MVGKVAARLPYPLDAIPVDRIDAQGRKGGAFGNFSALRVRPHRGVDFSKHHILRLGLSLTFGAAVAGKVVAVEANDIGELGRYVIIQDAEGWFWGYFHCERILVNVGDTVQLGEPIGVVGSSGSMAAVGGEHLHMTLSNTKFGGITGTVFDPIAHIQARTTLPVIDGGFTPIEEDDMPEYKDWSKASKDALVGDLIGAMLSGNDFAAGFKALRERAIRIEQEGPGKVWAHALTESGDSAGTVLKWAHGNSVDIETLLRQGLKVTATVDVEALLLALEERLGPLAGGGASAADVAAEVRTVLQEELGRLAIVQAP